jgi:hypothetical protein
MEITVTSSETTPTKAPADVKQKNSLRHVKKIEAIFAEAVGNTTVWVYGVQVKAEELANEGFLLPVILLELSEAFKETSKTAKTQPKFSFRMEYDEGAVLLHRVTHIEASPPRKLKSAIIELLKHAESAEIPGDYDLSDYTNKFGDFAKANDLYSPGLLDESHPF